MDDAELLRDVDDVRRVQRLVGTYVIAFAIASPVWLALLLLFPATGLGVGLSLLFASVAASALALTGRRWFMRNAGMRGDERPTRALTLSPAVKRTMLVCAGLIVLYVVLVTRAG